MERGGECFKFLARKKVCAIFDFVRVRDEPHAAVLLPIGRHLNDEGGMCDLRMLGPTPEFQYYVIVYDPSTRSRRHIRHLLQNLLIPLTPGVVLKIFLLGCFDD